MKSKIFSEAINNRNRLRICYQTTEFIIDPYFFSVDKNGKKVLYGKASNSSEVKKFEYKKIANIKILHQSKFCPIIPIIPLAN